MRRLSPWTIAGIVVFLASAAFVLWLPARISEFRAQQFAYVAIYFIALIGLNILTGYTGQISLGHGAFMAVGGYTTAILIADHGMKDIYTIPIAAAVAGGAGLLVGLPALRLTGLYLALATFAIAVAMPAVVKRFEGFTGGGQGINLFGLDGLTGSIFPVNVLGRDLNFNDWIYYLSWSIALVLFAVAWLILRGRFGRALRAVRDSETAAASFGVNLALYKTVAFGISAAYAGVAGSLFAIATTFVNPDIFPIALSIFLLVGVVVGGLGHLSLLIVGAVFVYFMPVSWAQDLERWIPDWLPVLGDVSTRSPGAPAVVFGLAVILVMFLAPAGASGLAHRFFMLSRSKLRRRSA